MLIQFVTTLSDYDLASPVIFILYSSFIFAKMIKRSHDDNT
jgi:hypothetical protein